MDRNTKARPSTNGRKAHITDAANELVNEGRKLVGELYDEGIEKVSTAQKTAKEYSDEFTIKIQKNPLTSVLIAAGVGFLLSSLFRK